MFNQKHSVILFCKDQGTDVSFPSTPEEIIRGDCCLSVSHYNTVSPDTSAMESSADHVFMSWQDIFANGGLKSVVASTLHHPNTDSNRIYTVHPNNVLLPIYRWYLIAHGMPINVVDQYVQSVARRAVDICEAFNKPAILTIDRRQNFNYKTVAQWLDIPTDGKLSAIENCISVIKNLCHRL